jgi:hypothetical protein
MSRMADDHPPADPDEPRGAEFWIAPFFRESKLWPVLFAAAGMLTVLGAWALLLAFVERNPFGVAAVLMVLWMSIDAAIRSRRRGGTHLLLGCIAGLWLLSSAAAVGARWAGWF